MKTKRYCIGILAFILMFTINISIANATNHELTIDETFIYLNNEIQSVDCYHGKDNEIRVSTVEDLYTVLPDLESVVAVLPSFEGYVVIDYFSFLENYSYYIDGNSLYIYTDSYQKTEPLTVFFNGLKGPWSNSINELENWATINNYVLLKYNNNVYLNNDGNTPVIIKVDNNEVEFPDQQPLVVSPGRTMVPIRAIAEFIDDVDVTWDSTNNRIVIKNDYNTLILWINSTSYWLNGNYHQMDVEPYVLNCRTMVPIRFIAEAFGFTITFDNSYDVCVINLSYVR